VENKVKIVSVVSAILGALLFLAHCVHTIDTAGTFLEDDKRNMPVHIQRDSTGKADTIPLKDYLKKWDYY